MLRTLSQLCQLCLTWHRYCESGNVLVSVRHQDTIIVVNWPRRELVWAWGQGIISAPHDASLLSNGNILLFDNGVGRKRSRVVEVNPVSREIEWEYDGGPAGRFYSAARGSAQRLPNGNTMVAVSDSGYGFEVTADGKVVWEFWNPILKENRHRATIIRAKRYEAKMVERLLSVPGQTKMTKFKFGSEHLVRPYR